MLRKHFAGTRQGHPWAGTPLLYERLGFGEGLRTSRAEVSQVLLKKEPKVRRGRSPKGARGCGGRGRGARGKLDRELARGILSPEPVEQTNQTRATGVETLVGDQLGEPATENFPRSIRLAFGFSW